MAGRVGDLLTVNGGTVIDQNGYSVEVMGPGYSTHRGNLIASYAKEGHIKVMLVYDPSCNRFFIYRFKGYAETHHYWSTQASREWILSNRKYKAMGEVCIRACRDIFGI